MAVVVEKLIDEPVIVLKPDAQVTEQELVDAWFRSAELAQTIPGSTYRIVDLRSTIAPNTIAVWLRESVKAMVGAPVTPLLRVSFVGTTAAVSLASHADAETWFETFDDALSYIRTMAGVASISN